jgi:nucleotide-binding universal stress UspA family protein
VPSPTQTCRCARNEHDLPAPAYPSYPLIEADLATGAGLDTDSIEERASETARGVAQQAGCGPTAVGEVGDPVAAILGAAEEHSADVVVIGSSDKGWWRRLLEGSVSDEVVRAAPRPVLVVRAGSEQRSDAESGERPPH